MSEKTENAATQEQNPHNREDLDAPENVLSPDAALYPKSAYHLPRTIADIFERQFLRRRGNDAADDMYAFYFSGAEDWEPFQIFLEPFGSVDENGTEADGYDPDIAEDIAEFLSFVGTFKTDIRDLRIEIDNLSGMIEVKHPLSLLKLVHFMIDELEMSCADDATANLSDPESDNTTQPASESLIRSRFECYARQGKEDQRLNSVHGKIMDDSVLEHMPSRVFSSKTHLGGFTALFSNVSVHFSIEHLKAVVYEETGRVLPMSDNDYKKFIPS